MLSLRKKFAVGPVVGPPPPPLLPGEYYYKPFSRTGTAATTTIGDLQFAPALVITQCRNIARRTWAFDAVRGALKRIPVFTDKEVQDTDSLTAFLSNGYTVGADVNGIINSGIAAQFAHWCFAKVPGFMDVQTYTGSGTLGSVVTHNLGVAPDLVLAKCRNVAARSFPVSVRLQEGDLYLNTAAALTPTEGNVEAAALSNIAESLHAPAGMAMNGKTLIAARSATAEADFSTDAGVTWEVITLPARFGSIAYSPALELFVASSSGVANGVFSSSDGRTWEQGVSADFIGSNINWCNAEFLSTSAGHIYKSVDGKAWTKIISPFPATTGKGGWSYICYGNGVYVAVTAGDGGANKAQSNRCGAAYSSDGLTWALGDPTSQLSPSSTYLTKIAFGNGVFVVTGPGGFTLRDQYFVINDVVRTNTREMYFSVDGITWNSTLGMPSLSGNWGNLTFANGQFLAVSSNTYGKAPAYPSKLDPPSNPTREVIFSTDGTKWRVGLLPTADFWSGLTHSDNTQRFYTVGTSSIAYSLRSNSSSSNLYNLLPSSVSLGSSPNTNSVNDDYIMYLFASMPGICRIGTYRGDGSLLRSIDCEFDSPARFVMIKAVESAGDWYVWDSARGIPETGNSEHLSLNAAAVGASDATIHRLSIGFSVSQISPTHVNVSGRNYLFMAIA